MLALTDDAVLYICERLSDYAKIKLSETNKSLSNLKYKFTFYDMILVDKITHLSYFDNFQSVIVNKCIMIPKKCKNVGIKVYTADDLQMLQKISESKITVTHLLIKRDLNDNVCKHIPSTVTHLKFIDGFNAPVRDLPNGLTHLTFIGTFNQNIGRLIPASVTHLTFGNNFNQSIEDCIPSSVTHLKFGSAYNKNIGNSISNSVTHLTFGTGFSQDINSLPSSITHLTIRRSSCLQNRLPSVTHLTVQDLNESVIAPITHLTITNTFDSKCIPSSVTHLVFSDYCNQHVYENDLPASVTHLTFSDYQNVTYIPNTVTHLTFGYWFDKSIDKIMPLSVTHITFGENFKQSINDLPESVVEVTLSTTYRARISKHITNRVKIIKISPIRYIPENFY